MLESFKIKMKKFKSTKGIPASLPMINIDTDMIIPKQFLKTIKRTGLGKNLFHEMRYDEKGNKIVDFILNKEPYNTSPILIVGKNFGCGSSREHAPWALLDFGIQCIIAPSFADIFYNNSIKNGLLLFTLSKTSMDALCKYSSEKKSLKISLLEKKVFYNNLFMDFNISDDTRDRLLNGYDDIELTLKKKQSN